MDVPVEFEMTNRGANTSWEGPKVDDFATSIFVNVTPMPGVHTVSIDDQLYRLARVKAAEQSTSISALFKAFLLRLTESHGETEFQRLEREEQEIRAEIRARRLGLNPTHNLSREELHSRYEVR